MLKNKKSSNKDCKELETNERNKIEPTKNVKLNGKPRFET